MHLECGTTAQRKRRLETIERVAGPEASEAAREELGKRGEAGMSAELARAHKATEPLRLAVALSVVQDPAQAARLAGLPEYPAEELAALVAQVRAEHAELIARRPAAVGALVWQAMSLMVTNLLARAPLMPPSQAAAAIKALAQTLELVQGGTRPAYTNLVITVPGPPGSGVEDLLGDRERIANLDTPAQAITPAT